MDLIYDHIQEDLYPKENEASSSKDKDTDSSQSTQPATQSTLNDDFQEAYRAISSSVWGARIGGFLGTVVKQGENVYREAQQELSHVGDDATRGFSDLRNTIINRTRSLSLVTAVPSVSSTAAAGSVEGDDGETDRDRATTPTAATSRSGPSQDPSQDSDTVLSKLRAEAGKRLKDLQRAEDAADEALLKFGSNVRDFLQNAISIAPPTEQDGQTSTVLFESKDAQGKKVIHSSRFDAQLHVIHTSVDSFNEDPASDEFSTWAKGFDIDKKTEDISSDLSKYPELRSTMESLVPDKVAYADFWTRYYFLRHSIETAEARRRDLLKAAATEDEVGWGDESDDEGESANPQPATRPRSTESSTTIHPTKASLLKPNEPRKSDDGKSQADSEASYDVVGAASGNPSHAPNSPKESRKGDDSDDDWE